MSIVGGLAGIVLCSQAFATERHMYNITFTNNTGMPMCVSNAVGREKGVVMGCKSPQSFPQTLHVQGCNDAFALGFMVQEYANTPPAMHHFEVSVPCVGQNNEDIATRVHTIYPRNANYKGFSGMTVVYTLQGSPTCSHGAPVGPHCNEWQINMNAVVNLPPHNN